MQMIVSTLTSLLGGWWVLKIRGRKEAFEWLVWLSFSAVGCAGIWALIFSAYFLFIVPAQIYDKNTAQTVYIKELEKQKVANGDEIKGLTDALLIAKNQQFSPDEWEPLTDGQIDYWAKELQGSGLKELVVIVNPNTQDDKLFRSLQKLGRRISCKVMSGIPISIGDPESSIVIYSADNDPASPILQKLFGQMAKTRLGGGALAAPHELSIYIPDKSVVTAP